MWQAVLWLYAATAVLIIVHEIDSAFWREWELFRLPGGAPFFMLIHLPLVALILIGLLWLDRGYRWGLIVSLIVSGGGLFAFTIHTILLRRGHPQFDHPVSKAILWACLATSLPQGVMSVILLTRFGT